MATFDLLHDDVNIQGDLMGTPAMRQPVHQSRGSRAEFEKFLGQVPPGIHSQLRTGKLRLADHTLYSIKPVGNSKTIKMFETQDMREVGLRNISNAKLPKNQVMLVSGIFLLAGQTAAAIPGSPTKDEVMATAFSSVTSFFLNGALVNGEFNLKANKVQLVPDSSNRVFSTDNNHNWPLGFYKLHNPRMILDDVEIEFTIELGTTTNIPPDTHLYLGLYGTVTTP